MQSLIGKLAEYGIVPRKTCINHGAPSELKLDRDFWRGLIDGDGCISMVKNSGRFYPAISFGGVRLLVEDFADVVLQVTGFRPRIGTCRSIFDTGLNGRRAQALIKWLYSEAPVALERKRRIAERCLQWTSKHAFTSTAALIPEYCPPSPSTALPQSSDSPPD